MNPYTLEEIEANPWLLVKSGKVRYFYRGQKILWRSIFIGIHEARVIQPLVYKGYDGEIRWKWVTNLGLPQPPSACLICTGNCTGNNKIVVDVDEIAPL